MASLTRKPTFIALRARHTAFCIASGVLWGKKIAVPPPPAPASPDIPDYRDAPLVRRRSDPKMLALALLFCLCMLALLCWMSQR